MSSSTARRSRSLSSTNPRTLSRRPVAVASQPSPIQGATERCPRVFSPLDFAVPQPSPCLLEQDRFRRMRSPTFRLLMDSSLLQPLPRRCAQRTLEGSPPSQRKLIVPSLQRVPALQLRADFCPSRRVRPAPSQHPPRFCGT